MLKCVECRKSIRKRSDESKRRFEGRRFCSKSCAATYNNRQYKKRKPAADKFCSCGARKSKSAQTCVSCRWLNKLKEVEQKPIVELFNRGNARVKYARIRKWARRAMELWGVERKCLVCGWTICLDVAHKRAIGSFPTDTPLGVVNARTNIDYLCPNHHAVFDLGLITIT